MSITSKSSLFVGVLLLGDEGVQFLDVAPVDVLYMLTSEYLAAIGVPESLAKQAVKLDIHYVSESGKEMVPLTGNAKLGVTDSIEPCPPLDILIIPGPPPTYIASDAAKAFIRKQTANATAAMSVCTGVGPFVQSGVLEGRAATAPLPMVPRLRSHFPGTQWQAKRWTRDANTWTSGGITNGLDMMAAFIREYFWDRREVVEVVLAAAAVGERGLEYRDNDMAA